MEHRSGLAAKAGSHRARPRIARAAFCREVGTLLDAAPAPPPLADIAARLGDLMAVPALLDPAERRAPDRGYTRHCLFVCARARFSLLAVVWPPGVSSPVHDHLTWCCFGVYEGALEETRFRPGGGGRAIAETVRLHRAGAADHLPAEAPDIHRMRNPGACTAVSIHVYGGDAEALGPNLRTLYTL